MVLYLYWHVGFPFLIYFYAGDKLNGLQRRLIKRYQTRVEQLERIEEGLQRVVSRALVQRAAGVVSQLEAQLADMTLQRDEAIRERDEAIWQRDEAIRQRT